MGRNEKREKKLAPAAGESIVPFVKNEKEKRKKIKGERRGSTRGFFVRSIIRPVVDSMERDFNKLIFKILELILLASF